MSQNDEYFLRPKTYSRVVNEVEAVEFKYDNRYIVAQWCGGVIDVSKNESPYLKIPSLYEPLTAELKQWVIRDEMGRYSVMDAKQFKEFYIF